MARRWTGATDKVDFGIVPIVASGLSFYCWFYSDIDNADKVGHSVLGSSNLSGSAINFEFLLGAFGTGANTFQCTFNDGSFKDRNFSTVSWTKQLWTHAGFSFDGSNWRCYKNSVLAETIVSSDTLPTTSPTAFRAGNQADGGLVNMEGRLAFMGYHTETLNQGQFAHAMRHGFWPGNSPEILASIYGEATEPDWSGNGNNGTVTGTTIIDGPPVSPFFGDIPIIGTVAAAGGATIPIFEHHYRSMRA